MTGWANYVALSQQLGRARQRQRGYADSLSENAATLESTIAESRRFVESTGQYLGQVGQRLRMPPVDRRGAWQAAGGQVADLLAAARRAAEAAADAAHRAEVRATEPAYFAHWPPLLRNLLVYVAAAIVQVVLEYAIILTFVPTADPARWTNSAGLPLILLTWIGLATLGFVTAWLVLRAVSTPRIHQGPISLSAGAGLVVAYLAWPAFGELIGPILFTFLSGLSGFVVGR